MSHVTVFFHLKDEVLSREVDPLRETIGSLFPDMLSSQFTFNGRVLCCAFTLAYSGITDGSHIYIVEKQRKPRKKAPVKRAKYSAPIEAVDLRTRRDWFFKQFGFVPPPAVMQHLVDEMTDPGLTAEVARLRDLFFRKVEGTLGNHRRVMRIFANQKSPEEKVVSSSPVLPPPAESPSTAELPVLWSEIA